MRIFLSIFFAFLVTGNAVVISVSGGSPRAYEVYHPFWGSVTGWMSWDGTQDIPYQNSGGNKLRLIFWDRDTIHDLTNEFDADPHLTFSEDGSFSWGTPVDPAADLEAYQIMGNIGSLSPGLTATVKVTANDGREFTANVGEDGSWGMYLPGDLGGQTITPIFTVWDRIEPGSDPVAVSVVRGENMSLAEYDSSPGPQQSSPSENPGPVTSSQVGISVKSDGTSTPIKQYTSDSGTVTVSRTPQGVSYAISGVVRGSAADGSFTAEDSDDADLGDIKNLLREANIQRAQIASDVSAIADALASPSPSPSPIPTASVLLDTALSGIADPVASPLESGSVDSINKGGGNFWQVSFLGRTMNFDPRSHAASSWLGPWIRAIIAAGSAVWFCFFVFDNLSRVVAAVGATNWGAGLGVGGDPWWSVLRIAVARTLGLIFATGLLSSVVILSAGQVIQDGAGIATSESMFNIVGGVTTALNASGSSAGSAILGLLDWFIPIDHILFTLANCLVILGGSLGYLFICSLFKTNIPA